MPQQRLYLVKFEGVYLDGAAVVRAPSPDAAQQLLLDKLEEQKRHTLANAARLFCEVKELTMVGIGVLYLDDGDY
jgi:hypothetical protein